MPGSIIEGLAQQLAAPMVGSYGAWRRMMQLPQVLQTARDIEVGSSPATPVAQLGKAKLLRYRRQTPATYREPVLICYALVNRPYILDLMPDKSVVQRYLQQGFEVYLIDWEVPDQRDRDLTLEDYVCRFLLAAVREVLAMQRCDTLHLLGYCMGGTMSAMLAALYPQRVKTLTLLASPIDFSGSESLLNVWSDERYFEVDALLQAFGNCPATLLQTCFVFTKPVQNLLEKGINFYEHMEDPQFLLNFFAVDRWVNDNIPVAGATFRQFVKSLYQGNELVCGRLQLGDRCVDLSQITCPLLLLTAKNDHLVASESTLGIRPHVRSRDVESMTIDAGHVGLVVSGKAHKALWPRATQWLAERSERTSDAFSGITAHGLLARPAPRQPSKLEESHGQ